MKHLFRGQQDKKRITLLLKLTNIKRPDYIQAIHDHLEEDSKRSYPVRLAASKNGIEASNLNRALATLDEVASIHEAINELDSHRFLSVK